MLALLPLSNKSSKSQNSYLFPVDRENWLRKVRNLVFRVEAEHPSLHLLLQIKKTQAMVSEEFKNLDLTPDLCRFTLTRFVPPQP